MPASHALKFLLPATLLAATLAGCANHSSEPHSTALKPTATPSTPAPVPPPSYLLSQDQARRQFVQEIADIDRRLSVPDFQARQAAMADLSRRLAENEQAASTLPKMLDQLRADLCAELAVLLRQTEPETQARISSLLAFREGLSNFSAAALEVSPEERQPLLEWGFSPHKDGGMQIIGLAFSSQSQDRVRAAKLLDDIDGPQADWVLAQLLRDEDREVSLTAMDTAWNRPATLPLVNALWDKAILFGFQQNGYRGDGASAQTDETTAANGPRVVKVGDRNVQVYDFDIHLNQRVADNDVATDLLVDYQSPLVMEKIEGLFQDVIERKFASPNNSAAQFRLYLISPNYGPVGANMQRLMESYKPRNVVNLLADMILNSASDGWDNQFNNQALRFSTRIDAMGLLCRLVDLDKDEFKLVKRQEYGNRWGLAGRAEEEEQAAKKIKAWWLQHKAEYERPVAAATTAPAK